MAKESHGVGGCVCVCVCVRGARGNAWGGELHKTCRRWPWRRPLQSLERPSGCKGIGQVLLTKKGKGC